jgi:hypothetical protein
MSHVRTFALLLLVGPALAACGEPAPTPTAQGPAKPAASGASDAEDLAQVVRGIIETQNAGDRQANLAKTRALIPTEAELKALLRPGAASEAFLKAAQEITVEGGAAAKEPPADKQPPPTDRTNVVVHAATTEAIAAYEKGTTAHGEFPGGMKRFAQELAAPGRTWYAVEMLAPGKEDGTRITCFTRLGTKWLLVPKPWRYMTPEEQPK